MVRCDICNKEFKNKRSMANHRRWHDLPEYKDFQEKSKKRMSEQFKGVNNPIYGKGIHRLNELNPNWKGDNVGLSPLHRWIKKNKLKPKTCEICEMNEPLDLANISGEYKRDINDYQWLCRKCHMESDGRMNNRNEKGQFIKGGMINAM